MAAASPSSSSSSSSSSSIPRSDSDASEADAEARSERKSESSERERLVDELVRRDWRPDESALAEERRVLRTHTNALVHETVRDYGRTAIVGGAALGALVGFVGALAVVTRRRQVQFHGRALFIGAQAFAASLALTGAAASATYLGVKKYFGAKDIEELAGIFHNKIKPESERLRRVLPKPLPPPLSEPQDEAALAQEKREIRELLAAMDEATAHAQQQTHTKGKQETKER